MILIYYKTWIYQCLIIQVKSPSIYMVSCPGLGSDPSFGSGRESGRDSMGSRDRISRQYRYCDRVRGNTPRLNDYFVENPVYDETFSQTLSSKSAIVSLNFFLCNNITTGLFVANTGLFVECLCVCGIFCYIDFRVWLPRKC